MGNTTRRRLAAAVALALSGAGVHAATITVNSADDDAASAFCNLRDAMVSINNGGTGTVPTCSGAVTGTFGNNDTIVFAAGLANATITLKQGSLGVVDATVTGSGQTIDAGGLSRVLDLPYAGTTNLSDLTLTHGHSANYGGAIHVGQGATLTLTNCTISNSSAVSHGGGIYAKGADVSLTNTTVSGNTATQNGAGIYANGGTVTLEHATISGNIATSVGGGVMGANSATMVIDRSIVSGNTGVRAGGVFPAVQGTATITASTISGNTGLCVASSFCGGGFYAYASNLTVIDSTVSGNMAKGAHDYQAGAGYLFNSTSTFVNTTITGNTAQGNNYLAGALWELHDNTHAASSLTLINCTIAGNSSTSYLVSPKAISGGVEAGLTGGKATFAGTWTSTNTIISGNLPADSDIVFGAGTTTQNTTYNLFGTAQNVAAFNNPGNHNVFSDSPGLGVLGNNGGPTATMALASDSPALNVGSPAAAVYATVPLQFDQRGLKYVRTRSGSIDIGAFEYQDDRLFADGLEPAP